MSLPDQTARMQALDPARSFIVQAPAGSGKTELLTQRYLRLLATVEQPEQILAITFTRKAASEMRQRILQSLSRASSSPEPQQPHEAHNWRLAQAALQRDQALGWQLEAHPARLRIQTIDALNASLARRLPMLSRMGAGMAIADDLWPIYEAVCARLIAQLGSQHEPASQIEAVLLHLANRVPTFTQMVCELLVRRDQWLPLLMQHRHKADLRASIEHTLQAAITHHLQGVRQLIPDELIAPLVELAAFAAGNRQRDGDNTAGLSEWIGRTQLPDAEAHAVEAWAAFAGVFCKKDQGKLKPELYMKVDKRHGFPADKHSKPLKDLMQAMLTTLSTVSTLAEQLADIAALPTARFTDAQWQVLDALLQLLPRAVQELLLEFQSRGQVDYVELSLRALQALGTPDEPTDVALALDARLLHILVDEFQDTSFTQMRLLQQLTAGWSAGDGRTLFCVGDPMQSIYRFRQAEVGLFLSVQDKGLPGIPVTALHLQTNFRSCQPIVDWVNRCFPGLMPLHDDAESGAVHYRPSEPRPQAGNDGGVGVHAALDRTAQQEAAQIRALVQQQLAADATQTIAILVSSRSHVGNIAREFKQAGIAFRAVDIERLKDRVLVQDLLSLTRALIHLGDRSAWLACLRAPWCGLTLPDLHALVAGDTTRTVYELLLACVQLPIQDNPDVGAQFIAPDQLPMTEDGRQRAQGFLSVISNALAQRAHHSLRDWVEQTWVALHGPATLSSVNELDDAQAFFARLDEVEQAGDLPDASALEAQLQNLFATAPAGSATRVEIMTIHKSKGLEFDVVILPSLHRIGGKDNLKLLRWTRLAGLAADGLVLAPPAATGDDGDRVYQWLAQLEKQRSDYERQRLLYVAATRAKRQLHLFASAARQDGQPKKPISGSLLKLLWPQLEAEFVAASTTSNTAVPPSSEAGTVMLRRLPVDWQAPEPLPTLTGRSVNTLSQVEEPPEFDWVGEISRHVGTVVHAELEYLVKLPVLQIAHWQADARRAACTLRLAELGVPESLRDQACTRVLTAIEQTLNDARGRWILGLDESHREAQAEVALSGVIHGSVVSGIVDRTLIDAEGVRWIIDFKTSSHEGGGREQFLHNEVLRYRPQLQRYATLMRLWQPGQTIRTALYFPLLSEWREVNLNPEN